MVNKRQYKNNRSYRTGYDDGNEDGFNKGLRKNKSELDKISHELADVKNELAKERIINDDLKVRADKFKADVDEQADKLNDYEEELADVKNELAKERIINDGLKVRADKFKADVDKFKADADKFKADADEQSNRIDDLQLRVSNLDGEISESYVLLASLKAEVEDIDVETSKLDAENRGINKDLAILRNNDFEALDTETLINVGESQITVNCEKISRNNTSRHRLNDEIRGLEIRIKDMESENYSIIKNMVRMV